MLVGGQASWQQWAAAAALLCPRALAGFHTSPARARSALMVRGGEAGRKALPPQRMQRPIRVCPKLFLVLKFAGESSIKLATVKLYVLRTFPCI